jgi:hypothetical protein
MEPYFVTIMRDYANKKDFSYIIKSLLKHTNKYEIEYVINEIGHSLLKHVEDIDELKLLVEKFREVRVTNINIVPVLCELDVDFSICEDILECILYELAETPYVAISNRHPEITSRQTLKTYIFSTKNLSKIIYLDCFYELLDKIKRDSLIHNLFSSSTLASFDPKIKAHIIAKRINTLDGSIRNRYSSSSYTPLSKEVILYLIPLLSIEKIIDLVVADVRSLEYYLNRILPRRDYEADLALRLLHRLLHPAVQEQLFSVSLAAVVFVCVRRDTILSSDVLKEDTILLWLPLWESHMQRMSQISINEKYKKVITYLNYIGKLEVILTNEEQPNG